MYGTNSPSASPTQDNSISIEQALTYLSWGWSVIPVILQSDARGKISKRPGTKWQAYQHRLPTEQEVRQWFKAKQYNGIGAVTGRVSGLVVVDIEREAHPDDVSGIASSWESRTISGGRHVFHRWTRPINNAVRIGGKPIDLRGDGGFVVLPPSRFDSQQYVWLKTADHRTLPKLPHHLELAITQSQSPPVQEHHPLPGRSSSLSSQLHHFPTVFQGERNATAAHIAGSLCANISPKLWATVAWPALIHWNQTQCHPPLDVQELGAVWKSITATHARRHPQQPATATKTSAKPMAIVPWKVFSAQQFKDPEWVVEGVIPKQGLVAVAGPPESCKSYLTTYIAITVARGQRLFDRFATTRTPVLLVDQENLPTWIQHRLVQFQAESELPLHIYASRDLPCDLEDASAFQQLIHYIDLHCIGLLVLDTLRLSHNRDENSSTDMKPVFDRLKLLTQKTAVIFVQHHRKVDRSYRDQVHGEDMMGSMLIRGSVDYQLTILKVADVADGATQIKVSQTKARYTKNLPPFTVTLEETNGDLHFLYAGPTIQMESKRDQAQRIILELLAKKPYARPDLIEHLVTRQLCGKRTVIDALKVLETAGKVAHSSSKPVIYTLAGSENPQCDSKVFHNGQVSAQAAVSQLTPPQNGKMQECNPYIYDLHFAPSQEIQPANGVFHNGLPRPANTMAKTKGSYSIAPDQKGGKPAHVDFEPAVLTDQQLQERIQHLKHWLLDHERQPNSQPPVAMNGQAYDLREWRQSLNVYGRLIDAAQNRGIVDTTDWLEMARMIFHADDGTTGSWIQ